MRAYKRTGPDTGVSHGLGTLLLIVFATGAALCLMTAAFGPTAALIIFILIPVVLAFATTKARNEHSEYERLAALDRKTERAAELERLRAKYDPRTE